MHIAGRPLYIIPNPKRFEYYGAPEKRLSKAAGRKGTKRWWKARTNRPRTGWCWTSYEPEGIAMSAIGIYATAKQARDLKAALAARAVQPTLGSDYRGAYLRDDTQLWRMDVA